ncbi:reverse transcriptase domain-containing protein [Tanacetum coccineum]
MRTRSSGPVVEPSTTPRRRRNKKHSQQVDPTIVEKPVVTMADTRTMAELLQAPTEGYGDAIVIPAILAENFELKHGLLNLVTSKQFCGFEKEDPHAHIRWFNKITSTIKYKDVPNSSIKLMLFPFSIEGAARIWLEKEPPRSIVTWEDLVSKFINQFFPPSKTTNLRNEITNFQQRFDESFCEAWERFKDLLRACLHHGFTELHQIDTFYNSLTSTDQDSLNAAAGGNLLTKTPKDALTLIENKLKALLLKNTTPPPASVKAVEESCVTCGGPHPYYQCLATDGNASGYQDNIQAYVSAAAATMLQQNNKLENMLSIYFQMNKPPSSGPLPSNTVANQKGDLKAITTRSGVSYDGHLIPPPFSSSPEVVEREPEVTKDLVQPSTEKVQPPDDQTQAPTSEPVNAPKPKPNLPYPLRLNNQKLRERDDHQMMKFLQMFRSLHFDLSFKDALLYMPKFASTFKNLLSNKEKLFELANTSVNENCSAVILKKLPEKLGDPSKFLIPCNFPEIVECLALADLGASINLMPLSIWRNLLLPEHTPTQMILELADRSTTRPTGIAKDVFVRVGKFYFLADFVVVDYVVDPRVPLILGRPFLRTARALIDVYDEELTLRVSDEAITFKVGNTSRYSYNDAESINRIDVIDIACEEYSQEVLGFSDNSERRHSSIEEMLNNDPCSPLPPKDLKCEELKSVKSSIDEPPELELKDLPSYLEYAFLEGTNKLPVIIAKNLKDKEKERLIKVLKSHKQAIAWKLSDIKGIDPCMMTIFHDMIEDTMEVFMDDFSVFGDSFSSCLSHLDKMLKREKVDVIEKLLPPTPVKGIRSFLGHARFYRRFIQDFSEIARPMTHLLEKETPFIFSTEYREALETLKKKLTKAPILVAPDWDLPFEIMCDANDFAVGAVLGQQKIKHF